MKRAYWSFLILIMAAGCAEQPEFVSIETPADETSQHGVTAHTHDYVTTPAGRYHRSCGHAIPDGALVDKGNIVRRADGTTYQIPPCLYPGYPNRPHPGRAPAEVFPPTNDGWIEYAFTSQPSGSWYQQLEARWTVPVRPVGDYSGNGLYYTFPAFQSDSCIIQPVLQIWG